MDYETRLELYARVLHQMIEAEMTEDDYVTPDPRSVQEFCDNITDMVKDIVEKQLSKLRN